MDSRETPAPSMLTSLRRPAFLLTAILLACGTPPTTAPAPSATTAGGSYYCVAPEAEAEPAAVKVYFGNLHAHSNLSDGNTGVSPTQAYDTARTQGAMDFLSLSEHNHMLTPTEMQQLQQAASQATTSTFVALFGQEYSTIDKGGNHSNIQNYPHAIPATMNGKYRAVFEQVLPQFILQNPTTVIVGEFNHPKAHTKDYGLEKDFQGDVAAFVQVMDPMVQLIAVANGPADVDQKNFVPTGTARFAHSEISTGHWFWYLAHGMHLAPKVDHDTHSPAFGFRVDGRTAVWVSGTYTKDSLLSALKARHCYATEDRNLEILATVNGTGMPGDQIDPASITNNKVTVHLTFKDADEPQATYVLTAYKGVVGSGLLAEIDSDVNQHTTPPNVAVLEIPVDPDVSSYHVIHVSQRGANPPCGKTDNAWLAPIWIEKPPVADSSGSDHEEDLAPFVGSKNSSAYHHSSCKVVDQIKQENRVYYQTAPSGKHLHQGCPK